MIAVLEADQARRDEIARQERRAARRAEDERIAFERVELDSAATVIQGLYRVRLARRKMAKRRGEAKLPPIAWIRIKPEIPVHLTTKSHWTGYHDDYSPHPRAHAPLVACGGSMWMFGGLALVESQDAITEARRVAAKNRRKKKKPGVSTGGFKTEGMTALQLQMAEAEFAAAEAANDAPKKPPEPVVLDELWEWSGGHWTLHNGAVRNANGLAPRARSHHAMVAIEKASKLLVAGGTTDVDRQVWTKELYVFDVDMEVCNHANCTSKYDRAARVQPTIRPLTFSTFPISALDHTSSGGRATKEPQLCDGSCSRGQTRGGEGLPRR